MVWDSARNMQGNCHLLCPIYACVGVYLCVCMCVHVHVCVCVSGCEKDWNRDLEHCLQQRAIYGYDHRYIYKHIKLVPKTLD